MFKDFGFILVLSSIIIINITFWIAVGDILWLLIKNNLSFMQAIHDVFKNFGILFTIGLFCFFVGEILL